MDKVNNQNLTNLTNYDKDARIGCKGKNKFWFGYKRHVSVDMQSGLINKTHITPANVHDGNPIAITPIMPTATSVIYADKGYCGSKTAEVITKYNCTNRTIKKNNMKDKNKNLDKYLATVRAPYERVFSKLNKKTKYTSIPKVEFQTIFETIAFNFKRLISLNVDRIVVS